jgi:hypothetical protein
VPTSCEDIYFDVPCGTATFDNGEIECVWIGSHCTAKETDCPEIKLAAGDAERCAQYDNETHDKNIVNTCSTDERCTVLAKTTYSGVICLLDDCSSESTEHMDYYCVPDAYKIFCNGANKDSNGNLISDSGIRQTRCEAKCYNKYCRYNSDTNMCELDPDKYPNTSHISTDSCSCNNLNQDDCTHHTDSKGRLDCHWNTSVNKCLCPEVHLD